MLALEMSFQIGGVPVEKFLAALLAFAAGDILSFLTLKTSICSNSRWTWLKLSFGLLFFGAEPEPEAWLSIMLDGVNQRIRAKNSMKYKVN